MFFKVKNFVGYVFLLAFLSFFIGDYVYVCAMEMRSDLSQSPRHKDFFFVPESIVIGDHHAHCFPPEETNRILQDFFKSRGITSRLFTQKKANICKKFDEHAFDIKKCAGAQDDSVVAFFPPDVHNMLNNFVFKTPLDGSEQYNLKRVFYAQAINAHLRANAIKTMRAPQKYLILLPGSDPSKHTDANYKVISEKIKISRDHGNVFDVITPAQLRTFFYEIMFPFGMCDLHIDAFPNDRNVVYDTAGRIVVIDTEPAMDRIIRPNISDSFENCYFFEDKSVIPEEFFIAQRLLEESVDSDAYKLGQTLIRWIYILNMGLIYPYRYYNFDTGYPPPQQDSLELNPYKNFSHRAFADHRRVIREGMYTVMINIMLCIQEIVEIYPDIHDISIKPLGRADFGPEGGGEHRFVLDKKSESKKTDGKSKTFFVVPLKEYLARATERDAGSRTIFRMVDGRIIEDRIALYALPGVEFTNLERIFTRTASPVSPVDRGKKLPIIGVPVHKISPAPKISLMPSAVLSPTSLSPATVREIFSAPVADLSPISVGVGRGSFAVPAGVTGVKLPSIRGALRY